MDISDDHRDIIIIVINDSDFLRGKRVLVVGGEGLPQFAYLSSAAFC